MNLSKLQEMVGDRGAGVLWSMESPIVGHDLGAGQQWRQFLTEFPFISLESFHTEKSYFFLVSLWWCTNFKSNVLLGKSMEPPPPLSPLTFPSGLSPTLWPHLSFYSPSSPPPTASQYFNVEWNCDLHRKWWCLDWFTLKHSPQIEVVFNNAKERGQKKITWFLLILGNIFSSKFIFISFVSPIQILKVGINMLCVCSIMSDSLRPQRPHSL